MLGRVNGSICLANDTTLRNLPLMNGKERNAIRAAHPDNLRVEEGLTSGERSHVKAYRGVMGMRVVWIIDRDQFQVDDRGVKHEPTGYSFTPYPERPTDGVVTLGQVGKTLANGECYLRDEIEEMARQLWFQHLAKQW